MSTTTTRRFRLTHENNDLTLEIDTSVLASEMAHEINNFTAFSEQRLSACDDDIYRVVARLFALGVFGYVGEIGGGYVEGREDCHAFVESTLKWFHEGWPDIEQLGISLLEINVDSMDFHDIDDEEIEHE